MADGLNAGGAELGYVRAVCEAARGRPAGAIASVYARQSTTWGGVFDRAARIAGALQGMGVNPGDRVAVFSANSDKYMQLYLAIPWAGGVIVPMNVRWSLAENGYALDDCTPKVAFVSADADAAILALFEQRGISVVRLSDAADGAGALWSALVSHDPIEDVGRSGGDLFGIFYTGGTTGRSKGVMLSHAGVVGNSMTMRRLGLSPSSARKLIVAPLFHMAAAAALTMTLLAGGTAVIMPSFDPVGVLDVIADTGVSDALLVPTMIQMMLNVPEFDGAKLSNLKRIMYGASPMQEATLDRIMAAAPHVDFYQCYGMTELSPTATMLLPDFHRGVHREEGRHRGAGTVIPGTEVRIVDENDRAVPVGEVGEIVVRGPGVMLGYWNKPELTAAALRGGWMHTGDGGRFDEHGVLYVVDRIKDMIVSGGENVYSAEVESAITLHPAVAQCAVIGVPDERWGERVHAVVVARPGHTVSAEEIVNHCRSLIADYKCPRSVEFNPALPLSPAGKVLKTELRAPHWAGRSRNVS